MSKAPRWSIGIVGAALFLWLAGFALAMAQAHAQPASAPASQPAFNPSDINGLAAWVWYAFQHKQWSLLIMGGIVLFLAYERHWKGLTGEKVSAWLGRPLGVAVTTLATSVATAGLAVAASGWKAIGSACLMAAIVGAINLLAQLPLKKLDPPKA